MDLRADEPYCYLTTRGRRTGRPHTIEIWFGMHERALYLLSGGREDADWVRNLIEEPAVTVRLGNDLLAARARVVQDPQEDALARRLLAGKYQGWREGQPLSRWARTALPVAIELEQGRDVG